MHYIENGNVTFISFNSESTKGITNTEVSRLVSLMHRTLSSFGFQFNMPLPRLSDLAAPQWHKQILKIFHSPQDALDLRFLGVDITPLTSHPRKIISQTFFAS